MNSTHVLAALALVGVAHIGTVGAQSPPPAAPAPAVGSDRLGALVFRHIGPEGNRVGAIASPVGDPNTYYAGAASGGIFKSTDGGLHWAPIFDREPVASIGALAVAPSDPNVVWAGTGEPNLRSNISRGWGVYRSTDAGRSWRRLGLEQTGRIARIAVHPTNPDVALVAALGTGYGPEADRGIFRTTDGGATWTKVLFVDQETGGNDVEFDPRNPRIVYATTWQFALYPWGRRSGGPGSAIWKSFDGGATWQRLAGNGLPLRPFGKADIAVAPSRPDRVYALIETSDGVPVPGFEAESGELWRSENGGATWRLVSQDRQLAGRAPYFTRLAVQPDNENEVWFLASNWSHTLDGGTTILDPPFVEWAGGDHHDVWIDPADPNRIAVAHDVGVSISLNRGKTWNRIALPNAQMYHVTTDSRIPYWVYGNRQDGPSMAGPSNSRVQGVFGDGGIPRGSWHSVGGSESGWATPDPLDPDLVWSSGSASGSGGGVVTRYHAKTNLSYPVEIWPEATSGTPADGVRFRFQWTFPLTISPHDHHRVYAGSQHVHLTTDGGQSWQLISPDLTRNDKARQGISGGLTPDNIGAEYAGVVSAIAESPVVRGQLWAGTNDGLLHVTTDAGSTWRNVTPVVAGLPSWATVSSITPSRWDPNTAWATFDGHQANSFAPWVLETKDLGKTWTLEVRGISASPLSYVHWLTEDPVRPGLLYLGTENALYFSFDHGAGWQPLQNNLPHAPVYDLKIQEHFNDLVIATYGRGFWILDDITPLQQLTAAVAAKSAHLFAPRPAYRFRMAEPLAAPFEDPVQGSNPPYGASLSYWLKDRAVSAPTITISDSTGRVVRTLPGSPEAGVNRIYWDFQSERSSPAIMRNPPRFAPEIQVPPSGRMAPSFFPQAVTLPPGRYQVRLHAGATAEEQMLEVRKDPNTGGSVEGIVAKVTLVERLISALDSTVAMINTIEVARAQLATQRALVGFPAELVRASDSLEGLLVSQEEDLVQLKITGRGQDQVRYPTRLAEKLGYLIMDLDGSDNEPTDAERAVAALLVERAAAARRDFDGSLASRVRDFNRRIQAAGFGILPW